MFIGAATIDDVLRDHPEVSRKNFFNGRARAKPIVEVRKQAILRLREAGFAQTEIARLLKCHYDTVRYWLHPNHRERRVRRCTERNNITQPWKKIKRRRVRVSESERDDLFEKLASAGIVVGNREHFKRKGVLTPTQIAELVLLRQAGRRAEARDLATQYGVNRNYARMICSKLKIPPKYRPGERVPAVYESAAHV